MDTPASSAHIDHVQVAGQVLCCGLASATQKPIAPKLLSFLDVGAWACSAPLSWPGSGKSGYLQSSVADELALIGTRSRLVTSYISGLVSDQCFFKWRVIANVANIKSALNLAIWSILGPMLVATYWR